MDALATRTVKAIGQAQRDMAAGVAGSTYVVSGFQAEFRGLFAHQQDDLALRLPTPLEPTPPEAGGRLSLSFARTPVDDPRRRELAAAGRSLLALVEEAQARFDRWPLEQGAAVARGLVTVLTELFASSPLWPPADLGATAGDLGALTGKLAKAIASRISGAVFDELHAASQDLGALAGELRAAPFTEAPALGRLSAAVRALLGVFPPVNPPL